MQSNREKEYLVSSPNKDQLTIHNALPFLRRVLLKPHETKVDQDPTPYQINPKFS